MKIKKAYKFRLKPNKVQMELMTQFAGVIRFLWNMKCYIEMNADVNAAKNILAAGYCRDGLWSKRLSAAMKQEPTAILNRWNHLSLGK